MLRLGITGGIGSGKSFALRFFEKRGYPVIDADDLAKRCLQHDNNLKNKIKFQFGDDIYKKDTLEKKLLAERAFSCEVNQKALNDMVHPAVHQETITFFNNAEKGNHPLAVVEASMLFEAGHFEIYDHILLITASEEIRIERALLRNNLNREQILSRMNLQMSEKEKSGLSHTVIHNNGSIEDLEKQLSIFLNKLFNN
ncbi:MAG: dephospho-CoA kinase [Candidatus Marinimicrobia bacterium]|nr:dephospho-CoA kinase [Candidatus Neomarinimicrobiota bacterium]